MCARVYVCVCILCIYMHVRVRVRASMRFPCAHACVRVTCACVCLFVCLTQIRSTESVVALALALARVVSYVRTQLNVWTQLSDSVDRGREKSLRPFIESSGCLCSGCGCVGRVRPIESGGVIKWEGS